MTERRELEIVPQIKTGSTHDGNAAKARVVRALAHHVADSFITPVERDLVYEMTKLIVKINVRCRPLRHWGVAVTEGTPVSH